MSTRPISPLKRPNSENLWFRMIVPPDLRSVVGKREIRESLRTTSMAAARLLCAAKQVEWIDRFEAMRQQRASAVASDGVRIVDEHLDAQIARYGPFHAIAYELELIAQAEHAFLDDPEMLELGQAAADLRPAYAGYTDPRTREMIGARQQALHRDAFAAPLAGAEAASRAQASGFWQVASSFLEEAFGAAGLPADGDDPRVRVAADHFLSRLLSHKLPQLDLSAAAHPTPPQLRPAQPAPSVAIPVQSAASPSPAAPNSAARAADVPDGSSLRQRVLGEHAEARSLAEASAAWAASRPPEDAKLVDEWRTSIARFVELHGDVDVALITKDMVKVYREALKGLPARPKASVKRLPLLDQIEEARQHNLPTLAGPTVAKHMSGLRAVLDYAIDPLGLVEDNLAKEVKVIGATSDIDARKAHTPEELQTIFASTMLTDPRDPLRTSDFWLLMLAPLMGIRIEEGGKLRPSNVKVDRGVHYISIERDSRKQRREANAEGKGAKRAKTKAAYRDIPVHWILIEAGFLEFVERQRAAGYNWLFPDLSENKYGDRTKAASQGIIRRLRALGIEGEEKVFHSFRHGMKRAARGTTMKEEIADLLAGHAPESVGRKYGAGAELDVLREAVNMIDYPLVDWDPVIAAARARVKREEASA